MQETEVAAACSLITTCTECEKVPICSWCSSPSKNFQSRCSSKKQIKELCPADGLEKKFDGELKIIKDTEEREYYYDDYDYTNEDITNYMRPQEIELNLNVGDVKYLPFRVEVSGKKSSFYFDLPKELNLKIYTTCNGQHHLKEVPLSVIDDLKSEERKGDVCNFDKIQRHTSVKFYARLHLKSCPTDASKWRETEYSISNWEGDSTILKMKFFCSCSCDKFVTDQVCRNDKKVFFEILKIKIDFLYARVTLK